MKLLNFLPKKARAFLNPPPNVLVKGVIERFASVVPLHVGGNAENAYALMLKGETDIIMFRHAILEPISCAHIALLQPGDYIEFEMDHKGFGRVSTLTTSAWTNNWKQCTGRSASAAPDDTVAGDLAPVTKHSSRPDLVLHTNENWQGSPE